MFIQVLKLGRGKCSTHTCITTDMSVKSLKVRLVLGLMQATRNSCKLLTTIFSDYAKDLGTAERLILGAYHANSKFNFIVVIVCY